MHFDTQRMIPLTELQRAPGKVIERLKAAKRPLLILDRGKPTALLVDPEEYEKQQGGEERKQVLLNALEKMIPVLIEKIGPEKIILFGSLARGDVKEESDLDLCVVMKTNKRPIERRKELVHLLQPKIATDFFVYTPDEWKRALKEKRLFFTEELIGEGKVLYEKTARSGA